MGRDASEAVVRFEVNASETAVKSKEEGLNKNDPVGAVPVSPLSVAHGEVVLAADAANFGKLQVWPSR